MAAQQQPDEIVPVKLESKPGVKRDGTLFEGDNYVDAQWCRWQRGLPRSMGGYRRLTNLLDEIGRGMTIFDQNNETYTHIGTASMLLRFTIDPNGVVSSITDRTPAAFATSANNLWQFDQLTNGSTSQNYLLAHAAPNALDISSSTATSLYYGDVTGTGVLTDTGAPTVSGGVVVLNPYVFIMDSNGIIQWCVAGDPTDWSGTGSGAARIANAKLVAGMALRSGAGNAPSGLFWTLNSVHRATFIGGTPIFQFDTISVQSSILSSQSVVEYDGIYFWCGVDRFLMYNGVVREVPNTMNLNWFFDNLNYAYRQRVFAYKVPRWGEIWWCYPRGTATECTHAVVYNVRENTWYDTELPNSGRSCGQYAQVFQSPLMTGVDEDTSTNGYKLWQQEFGTDEIDGHRVNAVLKFFETNEFYMPTASAMESDAASKTSIVSNIVEPDFVQTGNMNLIVKGRQNARSPTRESDPYVFADTAPTPAQELLTIRETARYMRFRFESNVSGGSFQQGKMWFHVQPGDARITS
jgi:hypothetical protein